VEVRVTPLSPLMAACAVAAWCVVVSRRPLYATVAALLTWLAAGNLIRLLVQYLMLAPAHASLGEEPPYPWPVRGWYFVELAVRASVPFAILAAALVVFLRRRPWLAALGWAAASVYLCAMYPELRRESQARAEAWIGLGCWTTSVFAGWQGHFRRRVDIRECYVPMALVLSVHVAVLLVVQFGGDPQRDWDPARVVQGTVFAALLLYQLWILGWEKRS
jgi:hypothetical protein